MRALGRRLLIDVAWRREVGAVDEACRKRARALVGDVSPHGAREQDGVQPHAVVAAATMSPSSSLHDARRGRPRADRDRARRRARRSPPRHRREARRARSGANASAHAPIRRRAPCGHRRRARARPRRRQPRRRAARESAARTRGKSTCCFGGAAPYRDEAPAANTTAYTTTPSWLFRPEARANAKRRQAGQRPVPRRRRERARRT